MAAEITLESPFPKDQMPRIWLWMESNLKAVADDYSPKTMEDFARYWFELEANGQRSWAVRRDGEMGGVIVARPILPGVSEIHVIFKREFWGKGTTLEALRMVCQELFSEGMRKLVALTFADNRSAFQMVKALGGLVEGKLLEHTMRGGKPLDVFAMAIHRKGFEYVISTERRLPIAKDKRDQHAERDVEPKQDADPVSAANPEPALQLRGKPDLEPHESLRPDSSPAT